MRVARLTLSRSRQSLGLSVTLAASLTQAADPQQPPVVIPIGTEVVRVDVVVTDKGGKPVRDLKAEDFQLFEDGQPQRITSFAAYAEPVATAASHSVTPGPPVSGEPSATRPAQALPRRFVILAVDDIHIEFANLVRLQKTLDRFLERDVAPEDRVGLVTTSGQHSHDLTDDREALRKVVARLTPQYRRLQTVGVPNIGEYQAELIQRGDREALQLAIDEILAQRRSPDPEAEAKTVARAVLAESINNSRATFETIDSVVNGLGALTGRKLVVLVSDGFTSGFGVEGRAAFDLRRITDSGTRAGVIVYALDSKGLRAPVGISASSRDPMIIQGRASPVSARETIALAGDFAAHDAMNAMAADTGGFLITNTNNLSNALQRILQDTAAYYVLAYEPTSTKRDGAFRKIEVRVPEIKNVRLRHRKGYFGPGGAGTLASSAGAAPASASASPIDPSQAELQAALTSLEPLADLPVRLSADFMSTDSGTTQVVIHGHVDVHDVPFVETSDQRVATVDFAAAVFDDADAVVGSLPVERASLELTKEGDARKLDRGFSYQHTAPLQPGRYRVSLAARDLARGKTGSAVQWVEIPDLRRGAMALSSLFLMKEDEGAASALRSVQAERSYARAESLFVQFFAYNMPHDAANLVSQTEIWRDGTLLAATKPEPFGPHAQSASDVAYTRKIKLSPFESGQYEVRVVVTNRQSGLSASERARFQIE